MTALTPQYFSPRAGVQHYLGLTMKTWKTALQSGEVRLKKYFYALRPLLAAMYILDRGTVSPMEFAPPLESADLTGEVRRAIADLLSKKKSASESATMPPDPVLHAFIADTLAQCHRRAAEVPSLRTDAAAANAFFREMLLLFSDVQDDKKAVLLLQAVSGSQAYGLATPQSDVDVKGIFVQPRASFYGLRRMEQVANESNDLVYYELGRFVEFLLKNNPSILELLATPPDAILHRHPLMDRIRA